MKILIVSARLCWPLNAGAKIRAYHLLYALSRKHQITLVTYYGQTEEHECFKHIEELGCRVVPVFYPDIDRGVNAAAVGKAMLSGLPLTVAKYYSKAMISELKKLSAEKFDIIHCEHLHMAPMVPRGQSRFVLDAHNVESQIASRYAAAETNSAKKVLLSWNYKRLEQFEMDIVSNSDLVLAVSEEDRRTFTSFSPDSNVQVLENGVDVDFFKSINHQEHESLVFVGSMDWKPNIDGIDYFLNDILPIIRQSHPGVTVAVVGKDPSPALIARAFTLETGVLVTGTVPDVRPYVENAAVCIVPLKIGGGTRLKVLEAFAMGKAVVSTSLGCEGIDCIDGVHLLIADDPEAFANAVTTLLKNSDLRKKLGSNARVLVEQKYSWKALGRKLLNFYDALN